MHCLGYTPVGLPPDDLQGEHNRPLDSENGEHGGEFQWDQQAVRHHGSLCSHLSSSNTLLIYPYHLHNLPVVLAVISVIWILPHGLLVETLLHQGIKLNLWRKGLLVHGETLMCALHCQNYGSQGMIGVLTIGGLMAMPQMRIITLD
jgi:hypothetical protein